MICRTIREFSRVNDGVISVMWYGSFPRCVVINMYSVYRAVMSIFKPVRIMVRFDQENVDKIIYSSPTRLIVGGKAKLVKLDSSHQTIINGRTV